MPRSMHARLKARVLAAQGKIPCDLVLANVRYLDVFSCELRAGDVGIHDGVIVGLEPGLPAARVVDAGGRAVVPGFVDAHVHVESSLLVPKNFQRAVLPRGTTTAICDPHELANVLGAGGISCFLEAALDLALDLRVMLSSCVPATSFETNGGGAIDASALASFLGHPKALGLAEMMNVRGVLTCDDEIAAKLLAFSGRPIDGHCPLVRGPELSAYAAAGIGTCHESSGADEAREKLTKGIACWIREGSVAKDLDALAPLLTMATSTSMAFCTDDRNPLDIETDGHIDHLVRGAIARGVIPEVAYRAASFSPARHYGLTERTGASLSRVGAIAPGFQADLIVLDDLATCAVRTVYKAGVATGELDLAGTAGAASPDNTVRAKVPEAVDLEGPAGQVHVIGVHPGKILTSRHVMAHDAPGVAKLSVLERHGRGGKPANGYALGFGEKLRGAIASSVGHDSHNLIVVGDRTLDMRVALSALSSSGGGFVVVCDGQVRAALALPFGGLMSLEEPAAIARALRALHEASRSIGCELGEPFLQLAFLSLPVIPKLKLTDVGLVDVDAFCIIPVRAA